MKHVYVKMVNSTEFKCTMHFAGYSLSIIAHVSKCGVWKCGCVDEIEKEMQTFTTPTYLYMPHPHVHVHALSHHLQFVWHLAIVF